MQDYVVPYTQFIRENFTLMDDNGRGYYSNGMASAQSRFKLHQAYLGQVEVFEVGFLLLSPQISSE